MISAGDFKKGLTFIRNNDIYIIVDFLHVKPGKGAAFVRTTIKNLKTGSIREETFNPTEKFEKAMIETKDMQYLYKDADLYYFMDVENYEQIPLNYEQVEEAIIYIKENDVATMKFHDGRAFQVEPPNFVELEVTEADPGVKGNTATGATKPATCETGAIVQVPLFVNVGDTIKVDTRTGSYLSRA